MLMVAFSTRCAALLPAFTPLQFAAICATVSALSALNAAVTAFVPIPAAELEHLRRKYEILWEAHIKALDDIADMTMEYDRQTQTVCTRI